MPVNKEVVFSQETGATFVHLLTVTMRRNNGTIEVRRFCDQYVPVTSRGDIFQPASFRITLGSDNAENVPQVNLEFDVGDVQIIRELRENDRTPTIQLEVVLGESPDHVEIGPVQYEVSQFEFNNTSVSMQLTVEAILNEPIPAQRFTPTTSPSLWQNIAFG